MKQLSVYIVLTLSFFMTARSQEMNFKADQDSVLIKQIYDLEFKLNNLLAARDFVTYSNYLADDYVRISADGKMKTKPEVIQEFQSSTGAEVVPEVLQIRIYGNTAILNLHITVTQEVMGIKKTRESLLTKVFVNRMDKWYMVSNQGIALR